MTEKVQTLHPDPGKQGVRIDKVKYSALRDAILEALHEQDEITFSALMEMMNERLEGKFDGSVNWYFTTVKLDLEARSEIERVPGSKPQKLRLKV